MLVVVYNTIGEVLMLQRADKPDYWQSVTGSLNDLNEPPWQAAQRELFEETGLRPELCMAPNVPDCTSEVLLKPNCLRPFGKHVQYSILPHWRRRYAPGTSTNTEHWFAACVAAGTAPTLCPREHLSFVWLPAHAAAEQCFSPNNAQAILELHNLLGV